jgi:uncharacterized protein with HEPN domain
VRDDRARLLDVREAIERMEKHTAAGREAFDRDELVQTWVVRHLEIIGEAVRGLSQDLRDRHSAVPWAEIVALRNILAHHYFGIDLDAAWRVVERDLPELKRNVDAILCVLPAAGDPPPAGRKP